MKNVSTNFQAEMRKPNRNISVDGTIFFGEDLEAHHIPEEAIVENSLTIVDQLNNGKFGYGSVYTQNLSVKLDYTKCRDVDGKNINLTNGQIRFWFYVHYDDGTEEYINIGDFLIDSARSSRQGDILSIYGSSHMSKLDVPSEAMENVTPYQIYVRACELAGIRAAAAEEVISSFPNGTLSVSVDTSQIQTARDMIMWVAELTGSYARAVIVPPSEEDDQGLYGIWAIDLVQSPTKYTQAGTTENFDLDAFKADNGTIIPADTRFKTEFTDTSVRITTVIMNINGKQIKDHGVWTFAPDTLEGTMEIKSNPLLKSKTDSEIENAIYLLRDFTDDLRFCPFKTTFNGNPAIECGDYVYLEPGGSVDETNFRHYGIVTYSKWTYPYTHEIRCATDVTAERPETPTASASMKMAKAAARNVSESVGIQPKSQLEKRVDALEGGGTTDRLVSSNETAFLRFHNTQTENGSGNNPVLELYTKFNNMDILGGSISWADLINAITNVSLLEKKILALEKRVAELESSGGASDRIVSPDGYALVIDRLGYVRVLYPGGVDAGDAAYNIGFNSDGFLAITYSRGEKRFTLGVCGDQGMAQIQATAAHSDYGSSNILINAFHPTSGNGGEIYLSGGGKQRTI